MTKHVLFFFVLWHCSMKTKQNQYVRQLISLQAKYDKVTDLNQQLIHILHHNFSEEHIAFWLQIPAPSSAVRWGLNLGPHNRFNSLNDRQRFNSLKYRKRGNFNLKLIDIWDGKQWLYCIILVLMASNPGKKPCQKDEIFSLTTRVGT